MIKRLVSILICIFLLCISVGCTAKQSTENNSVQDNAQASAVPSPATLTPIPTTILPEAKPPEGSVNSDNLRFIILADSRGLDKGINSEIVNKTLNEVKKLSPQPEFAIMPGDLTEGSKQYKEVKAQLEYFKKVITQYYPIEFYYPGIGNHEMRAGQDGEKAFEETFGDFSAHFLDGYHRTSYYFDAGDTRIFMLNSDHPKETHKITGEQLDWLKSNIDKSKKHNIFLLHEPPYPTGSEAGNSLDRYPEARDIFWSVIDSLDNSIVFCGHEHNYSRRLIDSTFNETIGSTKYKFERSIYQVISGGFGAPLYEKYTYKKNMIVPVIPQYHYTVIDINDSGISVQAINLEGEILDSFQIP